MENHLIAKTSKDIHSIKPYFESYYDALKNIYVDEIIYYDDFKMVKSKIIDDGIWNFVYDIKAKNITIL